MGFTAFGAEETAALREVIESQELWRGAQGQFVARLEDAFGRRLRRKYVLALSSGTSANEAALAACGIGPGDEVIVPPCSFISSSLSAVALGAVPVFADVDRRNLILTAEAVEAALTPRARAVVVVHLWGIPADMGRILEVARAHGLRVVEDCAQAYDSYYRGQRVGTFGDVACYSLQQSKHITSGEGGLVATDSPEAYARAVLYSNCGMAWYRHDVPIPEPVELAGVRTRGHFAFGHNHRMTELQGAVAWAQLAKIRGFSARRRAIARVLEEELGAVRGLRLPFCWPDTVPNYFAYPISLDPGRTELTADAFGFAAYNEVNYLEPVYQAMQRERRTPLGCPLPEYVTYAPGLCPQAEEGARRVFALSTHPTRDPAEARLEARWVRKTVGALLGPSPSCGEAS